MSASPIMYVDRLHLQRNKKRKISSFCKTLSCSTQSSLLKEQYYPFTGKKMGLVSCVKIQDSKIKDKKTESLT